MVLGNIQCQATLLTWITVGQGRAVCDLLGTDEGYVDISSLAYHTALSHSLSLSPSLLETALISLVKRPLNLKQSTYQIHQSFAQLYFIGSGKYVMSAIYCN